MWDIREQDILVKWLNNIMFSQAWFMDGVDAFSWEWLRQAREAMLARDKSTAKKQLLSATNEGNVTPMKTAVLGPKVDVHGYI